MARDNGGKKEDFGDEYMTFVYPSPGPLLFRPLI